VLSSLISQARFHSHPTTSVFAFAVELTAPDPLYRKDLTAKYQK
jgi:hypothetical protein